MSLEEKEKSMSIFDQREQQVNTQYNAQYMSFGTVHNTVALTAELNRLKEEIAKAKSNGILDKKSASTAEYHVTLVADEAEEAKPDKKTMLDHLNTAKSLIEGIAAASGLVTAIAGAIEAVHKLFP